MNKLTDRLKPHLNASTAIAFLALLFAISGISYAATGGEGGKNQNRLTAHTSKSKRGPRGPQGPAGAPGKEGKAGATGATGKEGAAGKEGPAGPTGAASTVQGPAGASVLVSKLDPGQEGCEEGGTLFTVGATKATACNGESVAGTSATSKAFSGEKTLGSETCKNGGTEVTSSSGTTLVCNGTDGTNGESVTSKQFKGGEETMVTGGEPCKTHGGSEFIAAKGTVTYACNGEEGSGGSGPGKGGLPKTLAEGETETGTWGVKFPASTAAESFVETSLFSFPIPLAAKLGQASFVYVTLAEQSAKGPETTHCKGSAEAPTAEPGFLCIYAGEVEAPAGREPFITNIYPPGSTGGAEGVGRAGAKALAEYPGGSTNEAAEVLGAWAVTG